MWTGQFAKRHNISQSTIGFYIKQGLLAPAIVNGRYDFRESDDLDMQLIAELKGCNSAWKTSLRPSHSSVFSKTA